MDTIRSRHDQVRGLEARAEVSRECGSLELKPKFTSRLNDVSRTPSHLLHSCYLAPRALAVRMADFERRNQHGRGGHGGGYFNNRKRRSRGLPDAVFIETWLIVGQRMTILIADHHAADMRSLLMSN